MEHSVLISLGTNYETETSMQRAREAMSNMFTGVRFSRVLTTKPIGMDGPDFINCLCRFSTSLPLYELTILIKCMEAKLGDTRGLREQKKILIDIDILCYDGRRLHLADWQRPYIPVLMEEINF